MSQEKLYANYTQMIRAIEHCVQSNLLLPALVMIYASIDSVSWLANHDKTVYSGQAFRNWIAEWMLKNSKIKCSAEELYAARCAVLHTLTPESESAIKKGVRKIAYSWGSAKNKSLEESIERLGMDNEVASIHLDVLFAAFREGMADYMEYVHSTPELAALFMEKANLHFANISNERLDEFLAVTNI